LIHSIFGDGLLRHLAALKWQERCDYFSFPAAAVFFHAWRMEPALIRSENLFTICHGCKALPRCRKRCYGEDL